MAYDIEISENAARSFKKLNKQLAQRIYTRLRELADSDNPFIHVKRLTGVALFSLRVGDYRVIMDIKRNCLLILVLRVGHRRNVYKEV